MSNLGNSVGWFEIYVQDMNRAKSFYESVFSKKLEKLDNPEMDMWSFPGDKESYGANGALVKCSGFDSGKNGSTLVYFQCEDCSKEEKRVKDFGGKVHKSKFSIGQHGNIALVYDTEGNMFGLHSMK